MPSSIGGWVVADALSIFLVSLLGFFLGLVAPGVVGRLLRRLKRKFPRGLAPLIAQPMATGREETKSMDKKIEVLHPRKLQQSQQQDHSVEEENVDKEWSTEDDEESETIDDSTELEYMEELQLKMMLIIWREAKVVAAQDIVTLAAGAAVDLVQTIQESSEHEKWKKWLLWWNRLGCAKIALRGPDVSSLGSVVVAAEAAGLPCSTRIAGGNASLAERNIEENRAARVVAVGPAPSDMLNPISGKFKLLS